MSTSLVRLEEYQRALMSATSVDEIGFIRAKIEAVAKTIAPRIAADRFKASRAYVEACVAHGQMWNDCENKASAGGDRQSKHSKIIENAFISISDAMFKNHMDALMCSRVAQLNKQDLEVYFDDCRSNGHYPSLGGAYNIWKMLNEISEETPSLPNGKYRCIVVDPPWPVSKILREERPYQVQDLDYKTMSTEEIAELPVSDLADESGCHIYLWVTHKYLPAGLFILDAWEFNYQCMLTWVKPTGMTPFSWMYNTEHVLFGRKGNLPLTQNGLKLSFESPVQQHSRKPDVFYRLVRNASPGPRLDMFARRAIDGFESWGAEAPISAGQEMGRSSSI